MIHKTKHLFQEIEDPDGQYNHVGMDGGKFLLEKKEVIEKLLKCREYGVFFIGLVPIIKDHDKCKFFFDVDHLAENQTIEDVMSTCMNVLQHKYDDNLLTKDYITKSQCRNRYHVYLPQIILRKQSLKMLWDEINAKFINNEPKPIDTSASALRYDGFWRFDSKKTKRFERDSHYLPYKNRFKLDAEFYSDTYLLVNDDVPISKVKSKFTRNSEYISQDNLSSQLINHNHSINSTNSQSTSDHVSHDAWTDSSASNQQSAISQDIDDSEGKTYSTETEIAELLHGKYSFLNHSFHGYKIKKIIVHRENMENENVVFSCGKGVKDRTCPFTGNVHRQNNIYFVYQAKKAILKQKCQSARCKNKWNVVYDKFAYFDELADSDDEMDDTDDDELWTDADLAIKYLEFNPNDIIYSTNVKSKNADGMFFIWNEDSGIWQKDVGMYKLKRQITGKFRKYMKRHFKERIGKCSNQGRRQGLWKAKATVNSKLGDYSKIGGVINAIKTECQNVEQLDPNDYYVVCQNGVYDLVKQKKVKPRRDEYVTNCHVTNFDIQPVNDEDVEYLFENLISRLFPDEEQRETQLIYISTILNGKTLKKFLINLGMFV